MGNPAMIPAEKAKRFLNPATVSVGDLYTVHAALGTNGAKWARRAHTRSHTVTLRDGAEDVIVTFSPTGNDIGQPTYVRVVDLYREPADALAEGDEIIFAEGLV